jgi:osmotically-inducible protein OsmY
MKTNSLSLLAILALTACAPAAVVLVGGSAAVGTAGLKEKGVTGTASDTWINAQIKAKLYQFNTDLEARISANVQQGEVVLTGIVPDQQWPVEAERICWEVKGVKSVINEVNVEEKDSPDFGQYASDALISTQIKTHLLFDAKVKSVNYSIKTVKGVVYLMGVAQSQEELDLVERYASNTRGVVRVMNYVHIKDNPSTPESSESEPEQPANSENNEHAQSSETPPEQNS